MSCELFVSTETFVLSVMHIKSSSILLDTARAVFSGFTCTVGLTAGESDSMRRTGKDSTEEAQQWSR